MLGVFDWLDPACHQQLLCSPCSQTQKDTKIRYLRYFTILMKLGNFTTLIQEKMDIRQHEAYAFLLPMELD